MCFTKNFSSVLPYADQKKSTFVLFSLLSIMKKVNVINVVILSGKLDVILVFCKGPLFLFPGIPFNKRSLFSS